MTYVTTDAFAEVLADYAKLADLGSGSGSAMLGNLSAIAGSIKRAQSGINSDRINIRNFLGDGSLTTAACNAAFLAAYNFAVLNNGLRLELGMGTFTISTPILQCNGFEIAGWTFNSTKIMLDAAANCTILKTYNFSTLTGTNAWYIGADNVPYAFGISNVTLDGNRANNASGSGVQYFGKRYTVDKVQVVNCHDYAFWSECGNQTGQTAVYNDMPESYIGKLWIRGCGFDGFHWEGPHDSHIDSVIASRCGQICINFNKGTNSGATCDVGFVHGYGSGTDSTGAYIADYPSVRINCAVRASEVVAESGAGNSLLITALGANSQIGILRAFGNGMFAGAASKVCVVTQGANVQIDNARIDDSAGGGGLAIQSGANFCQMPNLKITGNGGSGGGTGIGLDVDSSGNLISFVVSSFDAGTALRIAASGAKNNNNLIGEIFTSQQSWNNIANGNGNRYIFNITTPAASTVTGHFIGLGPHDKTAAGDGLAIGNKWSVFAILDNGAGDRYSEFTGITPSASAWDLTATGRVMKSFVHKALNGLTPTIGTCSLINCGASTHTVKNGPNIESFDATNMNIGLNLSAAGTGTAQVGYTWAL